MKYKVSKIFMSILVSIILIVVLIATVRWLNLCEMPVAPYLLIVNQTDEPIFLELRVHDKRLLSERIPSDTALKFPKVDYDEGGLDVWLQSNCFHSVEYVYPYMPPMLIAIEDPLIMPKCFLITNYNDVSP